MRKLFSIFGLTATGVLLVVGVVFAVGGGSGGSTPTCSADTWSCGSWTTCSADGQRVRTCTLTFDCPTASTPKPAERESCQPPAAPSASTGNSNTSGNSNTNSANPSGPPIANANLSIPECPADAWSCSDWSATCDSEGRQARTCRMEKSDCNPVNPPAEFRACETLQCGRLATMRERIRCRLNLAPAGLTRELQIEFLPEACRALADGTARQECIRYYRAYQPCWSEPVGESRFACARGVLQLGQTVREVVQACRGKTGDERAACARETKDKVYDLIKFRFYDLEQRAEALGERGANLDAVADFIAAVEQKKQDFEAATTTAARRQIILDVRAAWRQFLNQVRNQVQ